MDISNVQMRLHISSSHERVRHCIRIITGIDIETTGIRYIQYIYSHPEIMPDLYPLLCQEGLTTIISKGQFRHYPRVANPIHRAFISTPNRKYCSLSRDYKRLSYMCNNLLHRSMIKYSARRMQQVHLQRLVDRDNVSILHHILPHDIVNHHVKKYLICSYR